MPRDVEAVVYGIVDELPVRPVVPVRINLVEENNHSRTDEKRPLLLLLQSPPVLCKDQSSRVTERGH